MVVSLNSQSVRKKKSIVTVSNTGFSMLRETLQKNFFFVQTDNLVVATPTGLAGVEISK